MQAFKNFTGMVAPLDRANVDTDQIIPKQFLKAVVRAGLGKGLFIDWAQSGRQREQGFRAEQAALPGRVDPGGARKLRLRQFARACGVGAAMTPASAR